MPRPKPRFLAFGAGGGTGYTSRPLRDYPQVADEPEQVDLIASHSSIRDEPEAVGPGWLSSDNLWIRQQLANVEAARASRPALSVENRIRDVERRAKRQHRDLHGEIRVMRFVLERARNGGRHTPPRVLAWLETREADLDGTPASVPSA